MHRKTIYFIVLLLTAGHFFDARATGLTTEEAKKRYPYATVDVHGIDFERLASGQSITGKVHITNEGSYDLLIAKARSSCGLMIQTWPSAPVKPGDTVQLNFRFDSSRIGPFHRVITIHTNGWHKDLTIDVTGEVVSAGYE